MTWYGIKGKCCTDVNIQPLPDGENMGKCRKCKRIFNYMVN